VQHAVVVGAGVTGASAARELARRDWRVTLVEQYAPGTVRSASGGDTRLLRAAHGPEEWYAASALRALDLWLDLQEETGQRIFEPVGLAWLAHRDDGFEAASVPVLERLGVEHEWLRPEDARPLFPSLATDDLTAVLWEPGAGVLRARSATRLLVEDAGREGVDVVPGRAAPAAPPEADVVVWACGAWLPKLFPFVDVRIERRDVFLFGGEAAWNDAPGWVDYDAAFYGHGDIGGLGVKLCPDLPADPIDPDTLERAPAAPPLEQSRAYAAARFPDLAAAPLLAGRVCQYDLSADTHFLVDRHPEHEGWWLVGAGSGHGFKHGPALAEYVVDCVEARREPEPFHRLGARAGDAGLRTGSA
jgi:glycine/D-amino acid oxidase-like deaminating enzyme